MGKIERFEETEAWKKARELTRSIYKVTAEGDFARDFGLRDQIRRASISILSNIAEGFERGGDKEFRQFLAMAKGSVGEVKAQLYIALDVGLLTTEQFQQLFDLASETGRLIGGFMRYLTRSGHKGTKFKNQ